MAAASPRERPLWTCLKCGRQLLARRLEERRFREIETFSPRNHVHHFRLSDRRDVDGQFRGWLKEAYAVGEQRHLDQPLKGTP